MIDIKTQYAGLTLRNPIIVGSSDSPIRRNVTGILRKQVLELSY